MFSTNNIGRARIFFTVIGSIFPKYLTKWGNLILFNMNHARTRVSRRRIRNESSIIKVKMEKEKGKKRRI